MPQQIVFGVADKSRFQFTLLQAFRVRCFAERELSSARNGMLILGERNAVPCSIPHSLQSPFVQDVRDEPAHVGVHVRRV